MSDSATPRPPALLPSYVGASADVGSKLGAATVGLVSKEEFTRRREELEKIELERQASAEGEGKKKKKKKKAAANSTLSFGDDLDEGESSEAPKEKKPKLGKNPNVDTGFLPDRDREANDQKRREELARKYKEEQDLIKAEMIEITYSYWDGKGQRHEVKINKGATIDQFLNKCREQVRELRSNSSTDLMYVKEDLILPHTLTFYELISKKARGKSGPLFTFDVHDDVRLLGDHRVEKDESHAGKVMEKRLYERNKEKFPYSRFEVYDPDKTYGTYTEHGAETFGTGVNTGLI